MAKLNLTLLFFLLIILHPASYSQNQTEYNSEIFNLNLTDNLLTVFDKNGEKVYTKTFHNPSGYLYDLDQDGIDEFLVKDKTESGSDFEYSLYIYNLLDTFYLAGIINSGITEPYETIEGEIEGLIIVSGNPDFSFANNNSIAKVLPINCWKYEDGEIFSVNEELYEIFISENENILFKLDSLQSEESFDCTMSESVKSLITSGYINYLNAGEKISAENFIKTYYQCEDIEDLISELNNLFNKDKNEI